jgi:alanine dehydrogenase
VTAVESYRDVLQRCDLIVTCTPSRRPLLTAADILPGAFVAGVGADSEDKHELAPDLLKRGKLIVDVLDQCARIGDLHHALAAKVMTTADVHAALADVVSGRKPGRSTPDEITIFDSTGTALEDVAAAAVVYEQAMVLGGHREICLGA